MSPAASERTERAALSPTPSATGGVQENYDDPGEANDPATLTPIVSTNDRLSFPAEKVGERECWQTLSLSGDALTDFRSLVEHCGTPTGSIEYTKPVVGRLHHRYDRRDTFKIAIRKGLCYRFFGVGDGTIPDLDIIIERDGSLVGSDKTQGPVAIIDSDEAWCMDRDGQLSFHVQVHGEGQGRYVFGAWARATP
jgi:hypothetical protein